MSNFLLELGTGIIPWYVIAIAAVCAYFLGNVNPAILIGHAKGIDVRAQGSGNAGATNALRSMGKKAGALTFIIDVAKGVAGYYVPLRIFMMYVVPIVDESVINGVNSQFDASSAAHTLWSMTTAPAMLCGLCVALGHMYPVIFGFRGGKGVATVFGVLLAVSWSYALTLLGVVIVFTLIFRRVSLSVMIAVAAALVLVFWNGGMQADGFFYDVGFFSFNDFQPLWIAILLALVVWKHRANIGRLVKGQEPKLRFGGKKDAAKEGVS